VTDLPDLCRAAIRAAPGDEAVEAYASETRRTEVKARAGEVESLTFSDTRGVGVRVVSAGRLGYAYAADPSLEEVAEAVARASANAELATPDEGNALPGAGRIQAMPQLFRAEQAELATERKVALTLDLDRVATRTDPRVRNLERASYADAVARVAIVSTAGIEQEYARTDCWCAVSALAEADGEAQTGFALRQGRHIEELDWLGCAGEAVARASRLLGARKPPTAVVPVVLDRHAAAAFLGVLVGALSAEAVQKGRSLFASRVGEVVASEAVTLVDDGRLLEGPAAAPFDDEGVPTQRTSLIQRGRLAQLLHNTYTARRGRTLSTGNAGRAGYRSPPGVSSTNLVLEPGRLQLAELLARADGGVYVQDATGVHSGANPVSGQFSVGATGLRITGGALGEPLRDDGRSGYSLTVERESYERLLQDIAARRVDAVLTYKDDRLFRRDRERLRFSDTCDAAGVWLVATADGTDFDLTTADGRKQFREKGSAAEYYSDLLSERLRDHHERLALDGKDSGGERPFGFEQDRVTIREDEAGLIREAARRVIEGESLRSICADWNSRGLRTSQGGLWRPTRVRRMLTSPRYAGLREHHGKVVAQAVWPAILDRKTFDHVAAILADPARRTVQSTARRHILPGFLICGECQAPLRSHKTNGAMRVYRCVSGPNGQGCGKVSIAARPLERQVLDEAGAEYNFRETYREVGPVSKVDPSEELLRKIEPLEERLTRLGEMYATGDLGDTEFVSASKEIRATLDELRAGLGQVREVQSPTFGELYAEAKRLEQAAATESLTASELEQTRRFLHALIERIVIVPAVKRGGRFDPTRAIIHWKPAA
jgi:PmbA protein